MAAQVSFGFGGKGGREYLYVPMVAVGEDRDGHFVFVVTPTEQGLGTVARRAVEVQTLSNEDDNLEVTSGLVDGELVVTAGVSRIVDGQPVRLLGTN